MRKILLALFLTVNLFATNWYVDKDATGSHNGTSWANAWTSFETNYRFNFNNLIEDGAVFNMNDPVSWSGGSGYINSYFKNGTIGVMSLRNCSGSAPSNGTLITKAGGGGYAYCNANGTVETYYPLSWTSIVAGDTLFISGGDDTTYYYETMTVRSSGSFGNPIVITPGNDAGHNGVVIIDGQAMRDYNIVINSLNTLGYIKVDGQRRLKIIRGDYIQVLLTATTRHLQYVTIEGCLFSLNEGMDGDIRAVGGGTYKAKKILIRNNDFISTPNPYTCDRIVFFYTEDIWIDNNYFFGGNTLAGTEGYCHDDCIQSYNGSYSFIISNNYFYDGEPASFHQIMMFEDMDGTNVVYNNVVYMPNKIQWGNTYLDKGDNGYKAKYYVIHNTFVSGSNRNQFSTGADTMIAYNNLFTCTSEPHAVTSQGDLPGGAGISFSSTPDWTLLQGSHFGEKFVPGSGWNNYTRTQMTNLGAETFGNGVARFRTDPLIYGDDTDVFPDEDFRPTINSPLRDNGKYDLGGGQTVQTLVESIGWVELNDYLKWEDIDGNLRDDTPDIGAYKYVTAGVDSQPSFNFTPLTGKELNTEYIATSPITVDTLCHFWTTTSASFKINYNGTYNTAMKTADPDNGADSIYVKNTTGGTYNQMYTETIYGGGIPNNFNVTTKADPTAIGDTIPSAYKAFIDYGFANISTSITSYPFKLSGFDSCNAYFGGSNFAIYRSGVWGSPSSTQRKIYLADSLRVTLTTSGSYNATVSKVFTAGGVKDTLFIITKLSAGASIDSLGVTSVSGETDEALRPPSKTIDGKGALDGDIYANWAANPQPQDLTFDLGVIKTIVKTRVSFYGWNLTPQRIYQYKISASDDNANWFPIVTQKASSSTSEYSNDSLSAGVKARYIKLTCVSNNQSIWANVWEGKLLGITATAPPVDSLPSVILVNVSDAELDQMYETSGVFTGADTTFWVTANPDSFHIGVLTDYQVGADTAHAGDTVYVKMRSSSAYGVTLTLTLTAGGTNFPWEITTFDIPEIPIPGNWWVQPNGRRMRDANGKAIKNRVIQ